MIFFFGTRSGKSQTRPLHEVPCPYCDQLDTLRQVSTSNWFHFFWIRVFQISERTYADCSHCKRRYDKNDFSEAMLKASRAKSQT